MTKMKRPVTLETTFDTYQLSELIGEGGAGRVYAGEDSQGLPIAIKVLSSPAEDKRKRFRNEISFLQSNEHPNIVTVTDHGIARDGSIKGPFYVMRRYDTSLRSKITQRLSPDEAMRLFSQIFDGCEAAHFKKVTHRDLKPENILIDEQGRAVVADFGVAHFTEEFLHTTVETAPTKRLANFRYAAPEQREPGQQVGLPADIYALGLMLNEMFTGTVPHGTDYTLINAVAPTYGFLDAVVDQMIRQNPANRPSSIADVKGLIQRHKMEAVSLQKLSEFNKVVIPAGEVDDPLAHEPLKLVDAHYDGHTLHLELDRPVNKDWVHALHNMGSYSAAQRAPPQAFSFSGTTGTVAIEDHVAQSAVDHFKQWLPKVTAVLKYNLEQKSAREHYERTERLKREKQEEERRLEINKNLRI